MSLIPISKLLATAVAHCSTDDDISAEIVKTVERHTDFFKGIGTDLDKSIPGFSLITTIGKGLTQALAPEIMGGLVEKIEYSKMREYLITPNPNDLNHDLSKLLKKAALTSLGYIKSLWFEKLKQAEDDEQRELLESVFKQMKADLTSWLAYKTIEDDILKDPTDCLTAITDYIFTTSSVNRESEFATFFIDILPFCFKLAYKEALKDDDNKKAFIAFQIWILQSIDTKIDTLIDHNNPQPNLKYDYSYQNNTKNNAIFRNRYVPFVGREAEMAQLQAFFDSDAPVAWQLVTSAGGSGKSRLAMEFCFELAAQNKDYQLGFLESDKTKFDWEHWQPLHKTLIVIDYVAKDYQDTLNLLSTLSKSRNDLKHPVRFLLLERDMHSDWWKKFEAYQNDNLIPNAYGENIDLKALEPMDIVQIIWFCLQNAQKPFPTDEEWNIIFQNFIKIDPLARPLFAFYAGLALADGTDIRNWKKGDLLENHLSREDLHFSGKNIDPNLLAKHKNLVALATMMGGINMENLGIILDKNYTYLPNDEEFDTDIYENLSDYKDEILRPLEPDILGEYGVHKQLQKDPKNPLKDRNKATELTNEAWHLAPESMIFFVFRFYQDFFDYDLRKKLIQLPPDANEASTYFYCGLFVDLSGILVNNGLIEEAEDYWQKILEITEQISSNRILIIKAQTTYNLALYLGKNKFVDRAEGIYQQICNMAEQNHEAEVMKEVLVNKAQTAYNLALHLGNNNLLDRAEGIYQKLCEMVNQNHESEVMKEVLIRKAKAAYNLALDLGKNDLVDRAEGIYQQIYNMANQDYEEEEVIKEVLISKAQAAYNLALHLEKNDLVERAEGIYEQICNMANQDHEAEVMKEVLISKAKAALNLVSHLGENKLLDKAEGIYQQICEMANQDHEAEVMKKVLISKAKAAYNLALDLGKNDLMDRAEGIYQQICDMAKQDHEAEVMKEVLIQKAKVAYFLYAKKHFESFDMALIWINEEILLTYNKFQTSEIALYLEDSLLEFYIAYQSEIPTELNQQIKSIIVDLVNQYVEDTFWQERRGIISGLLQQAGFISNEPSQEGREE
jgi:hypothetical protein